MRIKRSSWRPSGISFPFPGKLIAAIILVLLNILAGLAESKAQIAPPRVEQAKPWLGVAIDAGKQGVLVKDVIPGTPAAEAGFKAGDEILGIGGTPVAQPQELIQRVQAQGIGNAVEVRFLRDGKASTKTVKLVARPDELEMLKSQFEGKPAPDFAMQRVGGGELAGKRLSDLKGHVVLIEFWATWCPACRSTHARLSDFAKSSDPKKLAVLAVSSEDEAELKAYAAQVKPAFPLLRDVGDEAHKAYRVSAIPMLIVVGRDGTVKLATIGAGEYLEEAIKLAEKL